MSRPLRQLIAAAAMVLTILFGAPLHADTGELEAQLTQWQEIQSERSDLGQELAALEEDHQKFVTRIENLKSAAADGADNRDDLEEALRRHLQVVEQLEGLQRQVQALSETERDIQQEIAATLDARRQDLEAQTRQAGPQQRMALVEELNEVQHLQRRFVTPAPEADQERIDTVLATARAVADDHPRAMLSVVDELEDTEDQVTARLTAIEARIERLEQYRDLQRQARQFDSRDQFFDESDRGRQVAQFEQAVSSDDSARNGSADANTATTEGDEAAEAPATDDSDGDFDSGAPAEGAGDDNFSGDPSAGAGDPGTGDLATGDRSDEAPQESETIRIETDIASGDDEGFASANDMGRDLQRLRRERQALEEQAEELRRRAQELRRQAESPEAM